MVCWEVCSRILEYFEEVFTVSRLKVGNFQLPQPGEIIEETI